MVEERAQALHSSTKKFEPHYRLVRVGAATKIEKASRQQRTRFLPVVHLFEETRMRWADSNLLHRKTTQEQSEGIQRYVEDEGCIKRQEEMSTSARLVVWSGGHYWSLLSTCVDCCRCGAKGLTNGISVLAPVSFDFYRQRLAKLYLAD
jgi:hypothetical protein